MTIPKWLTTALMTVSIAAGCTAAEADEDSFRPSQVQPVVARFDNYGCVDSATVLEVGEPIGRQDFAAHDSAVAEPTNMCRTIVAGDTGTSLAATRRWVQVQFPGDSAPRWYSTLVVKPR